ncbi:hypothetical protein AJ85_03935 [Alkalihalobacillus alcalophilus ATCC 27647 = CGMCC 1.3604]|uniref:Uncharacterized protein n=1 Tax=Alkalihalobacillus alcalophilus ATCC 27647 = CGMCC 1.3604 TaxID=1218173 RepID=A0A4S4K210_ALKAL|nr:hypothetical protein AJ85_03935 [Alkalihalobacillus alcalophilus ATCC 27647 = CGMCC 1.3604]
MKKTLKIGLLIIVIGWLLLIVAGFLGVFFNN